ncbi:hypothetical protein M0R45_023808 [Rubus argutus]|uniref:Uncharacterized protein n=1 Tax=Rubus argutus TaxID=59490 RepID=A0AAW1WPN5_RUBAR
MGEFRLGPNGPRPLDLVDYNLRVQHLATLRLRNRIRNVGQERLFYTPHMQRMLVRHQIMRAQDIANRERRLEGSDQYYQQLVDDVAANGGNQWPPPGMEVPNNQAQFDEHGANYNLNDPPPDLEEEDPDFDPIEPSSEASTQGPANLPLAPLVIEVDSDEESVHSVINIASDTSVIDLSDDDED